MTLPGSNNSMHDLYKHAKSLVAASCVFLVSACASITTTDLVNDTQANDAMLEDVLSVVPQLLEPRSNSLQFGPGDKPMEAIAARTLAEAGYGIQRVSADQGVNFFSVEKEANENGETNIRVSIGELEIARTYQQSENEVLPVGPFELAGTRTKIDPKLSKLGSGETVDAIVSKVEYTSIAPIDGGIPTISLLSDDVIKGVLNNATNAPGYTSINASKLEINNRYYDDAGAFASLLNQRERVARETIIFPNDSMRLGEEGKRRISQLLSQFLEGEDLINVIGCSNGPTKLEIGNEGLALGRAKRITEELLTQGVPSRAILDDACWSPEGAGDRFPSRGVVVDLMRSAS